MYTKKLIRRVEVRRETYKVNFSRMCMNAFNVSMIVNETALKQKSRPVVAIKCETIAVFGVIHVNVKQAITIRNALVEL